MMPSVVWLFSLFPAVTLGLGLIQAKTLKDKVVEVQLNGTVSQACHIVGHLFVINGTMSPLYEVAFHLVGSQSDLLIALLAIGHGF